MGICLSLSSIYQQLEFENYELVIEENLKLKSLLDNSLPVRAQLPIVLSTLAGCPGNTSETYSSLDKVYQEYSSLNRTLWNDVKGIESPYTFSNPWTFAGSFFFTISLVTTIGYGSFTPTTCWGQLLVIFSSLPAIYITILFGRKNIRMFKAGLCKTKYENIAMIIFFSAVLLGFFLLVGGQILSKHEGWTFLESVYFISVSSTTIGFGDYAPRVGGEHFNLIYLSIVIVGWHIITFVISVMEVTLGALRQVHWWIEHHLLPCGRGTTVSRRELSEEQPFQVINEAEGYSDMIVDSSLMLTPQRNKRTMTEKIE